MELKAVCEESTFWRLGARKHISWWFDRRGIEGSEYRREGELCEVFPSSGILGPGQSIYLTVSIHTAGEKQFKTHTHHRMEHPSK